MKEESTKREKIQNLLFTFVCLKQNGGLDRNNGIRLSLFRKCHGVKEEADNNIYEEGVGDLIYTYT